jgi:hypothetical protein
MQHAHGLEIGEYLRFYIGAEPDNRTIDWPPDGFACAALILERSSAYLAVIHEGWFPAGITSHRDWTKYVRKLGRDWRKAVTAGKRPPKRIRDAWKTVCENLDRPITSISKTLTGELMVLFAAADEACEGVGIPGASLSEFEWACVSLLSRKAMQEKDAAPSTLCFRLSPTRLWVLPKLHTPQSGISLRSLSHHLAFGFAGDAKPFWYAVPSPQFLEEREVLNVLVLPWPLETTPSMFSDAGATESMDDSRFRFFAYRNNSWTKPSKRYSHRRSIQEKTAAHGPECIGNHGSIGRQKSYASDAR